jgi:hypothetical protein
MAAAAAAMPRSSLSLLLVLLLAALARAQEDVAAAHSPAPSPPRAVGDRVLAHGGKASLSWLAAVAGNDSSIAARLSFMFGRLAEVTPGGEVVRRVPSLARMDPSTTDVGAF